jgi:hypothetical protein
VNKSLCSGAERINLGRPRSDQKRKVASPQSVVQLNGVVHLSVNGTRRRCTYCSTKEVKVRSNIEGSTCKLAFCVTDEKNCFFEYPKVFMEAF